MLFPILIPIIKNEIKVTNVYDLTPVQKSFPYIVLSEVTNAKWANLVDIGLRVTFVCDIYIQGVSLNSILGVIYEVIAVITNPIVLNQYPEIRYVTFNHYKVKQDGSVLIGSIYYETLILD